MEGERNAVTILHAKQKPLNPVHPSFDTCETYKIRYQGSRVVPLLYSILWLCSKKTEIIFILSLSVLSTLLHPYYTIHIYIMHVDFVSIFMHHIYVSNSRLSLKFIFICFIVLWGRKSQHKVSYWMMGFFTSFTQSVTGMNSK